jgi:hypothetical protein
MIQMGPALSGGSCPSTASGVSVQHLKLTSDASGAYYGIDNECAQSASYVDDVGMENINGTGLRVGSGAANSGPYTNLSISVRGSSCSTAATASCVDLESQTRGLHGLTCLGNQNTSGTGTAGNAGVIVNASSNSLEDIHVEAFWDGVEVGDTSSSIDNITVANVLVSKSEDCSSAGGVTNAVHICGPHSSSTYGACNNYGSSSGTVQDVSVIGVSNLTPPSMTSVQDDQTSTTIPGCTATGCATPITSALYALGRTEGGDYGYSRFASNPASSLYGSTSSLVPTWGLGTTASVSGTPCYTPGTLYSYTAGTSGADSVNVCTFSTGSSTGYAWSAIP